MDESETGCVKELSPESDGAKPPVNGFAAIQRVSGYRKTSDLGVRSNLMETPRLQFDLHQREVFIFFERSKDAHGASAIRSCNGLFGGA